MPTESPLPVSANVTNPLPKLVGPVNNPLYRSKFTRPVGPVCIAAAIGWINAPPENCPEPAKVSPVKLMGPLPVATTLDPTCSSVTL